MTQLLLATYSIDDFPVYKRWAETLQVGLEIHDFANPAVLSANGELDELLEQYEKELSGFSGPLGFHGAFYDMVSASLDPAVVALTLQRYRQNLEVAARLGGQYVVFHANYMGGFKLANYREGWHERQLLFWRAFMEETDGYDVTVLLENMWADDPTIIPDLLAEIDHPRLQACLDVAHAALYSSTDIESWIDAVAPYLFCCHLNNHDGRLDLHWPLSQGVIDYGPVLTRLRRLPQPPLLTLEMPDLETVQSSLQYLEMGIPT